MSDLLLIDKGRLHHIKKPIMISTKKINMPRIVFFIMVVFSMANHEIIVLALTADLFDNVLLLCCHIILLAFVIFTILRTENICPLIKIKKNVKIIGKINGGSFDLSFSSLTTGII